MKTRLYITITLLLATIVIAFALPKPQYESPDIIGTLGIPHIMRDWRSKDMAKELNLEQDDRYNFVSDVFARLYGTRAGESLLFLVADVNNFHPPKVCFHSSGFKINDFGKMDFKLNQHILKTNTIYAGKKDSGFLVISWLVINKNLMQSFVQGEIHQLFSNLFNKKRTGLMIRLDIPTSEDNIETSLKLAEMFLRDLEGRLKEEDSEYIFGKIK
ncbi:MAG: exosortase-associated EpsI family protein [Candidatus Omnitrophica bacterium]|nr:exosortase-associated EpsI family protein [Candidatus Omnitrophota bacterium]